MKKLYISPVAVRIPACEIPTLMAGSPQTDHGDSKEADFGFDTEDANPWNSEDNRNYDPWK